MEDKIYLKDLECYGKADENQIRKTGRQPYFDLSLLPADGLREEIRRFIKERGKTVTLATIDRERQLYNRLCRFLAHGNHKMESFREKEEEKWMFQLRTWMLEEGQALTLQGESVYGKEKITPSALITYFRRLLRFLEPADERDEVEKDVWHLERLGIPIHNNPIKNYRTLNFTGISQPDIREEVKKAVFLHLKYEAVSTVSKELTAVRRLSDYLKGKYPEVESCTDISREIFEAYLVHLQTDECSLKKCRADLTKLRSVIGSIGKLYNYASLEQLFLNTDMPPTSRTEYQAYSDAELKRLNAHIVRMDEQTARAMVIHQMLGTRISDTLTLCTDCLYEADGQMMIRIKQVKTGTFEKPISAELAQLVNRAIDYTKEKHGETRYIFVNDNDTGRPLQYNTIQNKVMEMIRKEGLRDDRGNLFGFATHMFRHSYGLKLTEMHVDDWTIAKLLGHRSLKNVKYYRKMGNQMLEDETREVRWELSDIIYENLDGWGEEYEQIRENAYHK